MSGKGQYRIIKMAVASQFTSRYKKDLSTETLRAKVARRKSTLQKENRHKLFEKGRQFGLADVNVQLPDERGNSQPNEKSEKCSQENSSVKQKQPTNAATKRIADRREMLQRYKEEKELRKLIEQREKAKKGGSCFLREDYSIKGQEPRRKNCDTNCI
ncbi:hypothetical protein AV530_009746 [Patagioenas fasciata monilis]|uniref:Uncharacterized protein n=1 Tax=Patagioenas fasciata monilis TaxID=372326 RepID=A0A1V4KA52_PATFA|nr:hypothetical protein AV530_009746 [Patagioenas fasciata monilis]